MTRKTPPNEKGAIKFPRRLWHSREGRDVSKPFVESAEALTDLDRQRLTRLDKMLDEYDPKDAENFAFVTSQVLTVARTSETVAHTLGVAVSTLHRWAHGETVPPVTSRIGARLVYRDLIAQCMGAESATIDALKAKMQTEVLNVAEDRAPVERLRLSTELVETND